MGAVVGHMESRGNVPQLVPVREEEVSLARTPKLQPGEFESQLPASLRLVMEKQREKEEEAIKRRTAGGGVRWRVIGDDDVRWRPFSAAVILDVINWFMGLFRSNKGRISVLEEEVSQLKGDQVRFTHQADSAGVNFS